MKKLDTAKSLVDILKESNESFTTYYLRLWIKVVEVTEGTELEPLRDIMMRELFIENLDSPGPERSIRRARVTTHQGALRVAANYEHLDSRRMMSSY